MALDKDFLTSTSAIKMLSLSPSGALQPLRHSQSGDLIPSGQRSESGKRRFSSSRAKLVCVRPVGIGQAASGGPILVWRRAEERWGNKNKLRESRSFAKWRADGLEKGTPSSARPEWPKDDLCIPRVVLAYDKLAENK